MTSMTRAQRLKADHESMRALKQASTILDFETTGDPPDRYAVTFRGRGMYRENRSGARVQFLDSHQCEIRLPYSYPDRPPDVRWLSRAFHPNISFSGFINFREIDLPWSPEMGLDQLCRRLWDMIRLEFVNLDRATNYAADKWFEEQTELDLPLDDRTLDDIGRQAISSVVRYRRKGATSPEFSERPAAAADVLYIGDEPPLTPPARRRPPDDEDVLYIGD